MMNNKDASKEITQKQERLKQMQIEEKKVANKYDKIKKEFEHVQKLINAIRPAKLKQFIRTTGAYLLGRRNRKQLYSATYKKKQASNDLKPYLQALYNDGFIEEALTDLQVMHQTTNNLYVRQAIAWELALWFANKQTENGAFQAIPYVHEAKQNEKNNEVLRRLAIIEAECFVTIGENQRAHEILLKQLNMAIHPDIYLALANTEQTVNKKLYWMNKMYEFYQLEPISLQNEQFHYDALQMKKVQKKIADGPKVSVILPSYNAEQGIQIAIESILGQTWTNLELLIVDDHSSDNTLDVIQAYAKEDDRIKVMSTKENSGPYVARNMALEQATGEFVTVNDADDWSHSDKLRIQIEHLLHNESILANTSEQARLTESLQFYRRGNPGSYIFSNMSSFMFRKNAVMEILGYWDSVRFAGDGEFIRRFIQQFGEAKLAYLKTGPLSFPRQSDASLTSSSAFGYSGFFMGVRKEYVESFKIYHAEADTLYYPKEQTTRLFPVPAPMHPTYKKGNEQFDVIMFLDMHNQTEKNVQLLEKELKKSRQLGHKIGVVQKTSYDPYKKQTKSETQRKLRLLLQRYDVRIVVYGEKVTCDVLIIRSPEIVRNWSRFTPSIKTVACLVIIDEIEKMEYNGERLNVRYFRECMQQIMLHLDKKGRWYPLNERIRHQLTTNYTHEIRTLYIAPDNWTDESEKHEEKYALRLKDWVF